jgi:hypothetical protein
MAQKLTIPGPRTSDSAKIKERRFVGIAVKLLASCSFVKESSRVAGLWIVVRDIYNYHESFDMPKFFCLDEKELKRRRGVTKPIL